MERVLVTGVTGRVGANLALSLLERGRAVRGMVHPDDPSAARFHGLRGLELVTAALRDADAIARAVDGVDAVVHLAAQMLRGDTPVDDFFDTNTMGTLRVLEAAARSTHPVRRFVLASTDAVYRPTRLGLDPAGEEHHRRPGDYYGTSKLLAEELVRNYGTQFDLPWTIVRYGTVVAPDETLGLFRYRWVRALLQVAEQGRSHHLWPLYVDCPRPWEVLDAAVTDADKDPAVVVTGPGGPWALHLTDVRDTVAGTVVALEHPDAAGETYNIVGPGSVDFSEGARMIAHALELPVIEVALPMRFAFTIDNRKARGLGFHPQWSFPAMIDSALQFRAGALPGVVGATADAATSG